MKICVTCKIPKDDFDFSFKNKAKNIRANICKECQKEYAKNHYNLNVAYYVNKASRNRENVLDSLRCKMMKFLIGKSCSNCSESDPIVLEFHHKNSEEKKYSISFISGVSWRRTLEEIKKCDILCANCHRRKTAEERNWYRFLKKA